MASTEISSKEKWANATQKLQDALQREVTVMREVLGNLREEEVTLLEKRQKEWKKVMKHRSDFVLQLLKIRVTREKATASLEKMAIGNKRLLEESCEIYSQLDQLIALIERVNLQNCRNDALFEETKQRDFSSSACTYPHPLHKTRRSKKRSQIATYTQEK